MTPIIRAPFVGAVYQARTKTGRRWEVDARIDDDTWRIRLMGDDVSRARLATTQRLCDPKRWKLVGVTTRSLP